MAKRSILVRPAIEAQACPGGGRRRLGQRAHADAACLPPGGDERDPEEAAL